MSTGSPLETEPPVSKEELLKEYDKKCDEAWTEIRDRRKEANSEEGGESFMEEYRRVCEELKNSYIASQKLTEEDFRMADEKRMDDIDDINKRKIDWNATFHPFLFSGEMNRKNFWFGMLSWAGVVIVFSIVLAVADGSTIFDFLGDMLYVDWTFWTVVKAIIVVCYMPLCIISATIRRLRDAGLNVWLWLLGLIPVLGQIALIVLCSQPTKKKSLTLKN